PPRASATGTSGRRSHHPRRRATCCRRTTSSRRSHRRPTPVLAVHYAPAPGPPLQRRPTRRPRTHSSRLDAPPTSLRVIATSSATADALACDRGHVTAGAVSNGGLSQPSDTIVQLKRLVTAGTMQRYVYRPVASDSDKGGTSDEEQTHADGGDRDSALQCLGRRRHVRPGRPGQVHVERARWALVLRVQGI